MSTSAARLPDPDTAAAAAAEAGESEEWEESYLAELRGELTELGLATNGIKADLVEVKKTAIMYSDVKLATISAFVSPLP